MKYLLALILFTSTLSSFAYNGSHRGGSGVGGGGGSILALIIMVGIGYAIWWFADGKDEVKKREENKPHPEDFIGQMMEERKC